ncbi:MAG: hypothetical protein PHE84_05900 [bacterium]|nr:hypothetical protein [bacterium]
MSEVAHTPAQAGSGPVETREILRLSGYQRFIHLLVVIAFFILAFTGIPLKFHEWAWAKMILSALGGYENARYLHRFGAILTFIYIGLYFAEIAYRFVIKREKGLFWGPDSIIPRVEDVIHVAQMVIWFCIGGRRPKIDRWAYWEKFDFFAEAWGNFALGVTGLILWFPAFFTRLLPGFAISMSTIIHGIEASLAVCFIFFIHFFNAHLRREKFPMDMVIVTGRMSMHEFAEDRPAELERVQKDNALFWHQVPPASPVLAKVGRTVGLILLVLGLGISVCITYSSFAEWIPRVIRFFS